MRAKSLASGYRALAILAVLLLWGPYVLNGGLKANLLAPLKGKLNEDITFKTDYTGIFILDYPIALLVAFFYFATDGSDEGYQLVVFEGYSTLQSSFVWLYAESMRPGSKPWTIATSDLPAIATSRNRRIMLTRDSLDRSSLRHSHRF